MLLKVKYLYLLTIYLVSVPFCPAKMFENVRELSNVLKNIPGDIKPRQNQTEKVEVYLTFNNIIIIKFSSYNHCNY
jgi:hypothetical protein